MCLQADSNSDKETTLPEESAGAQAQETETDEAEIIAIVSQDHGQDPKWRRLLGWGVGLTAGVAIACLMARRR